MNVTDVINSVTERAKETANVRVVFGDPIETDGLTIIPVATVKISGGGGGGNRSGKSPSQQDELEAITDSDKGMGLGLQVVATPIGFIEVRDGQAQFTDIIDKNKLAFGGLVVGGLLLLTAAKLLTWKVKHRS